MRWKAPRNEDASRSKWKVSFATGNRKVSFAEAVGLIFHLHSAVSAGAPQAIQVADRFHVAVRRIGAYSIPFGERRG